MHSYRPTYAEISCASLEQNLQIVQQAVGPAVGTLTMIKADAYGHGAVQVARWLAAAGVTAFGVATIEEGIELREAGMDQPIVVMGGLMAQGERAADAAVAHDLTCVIHSVDAVLPLAVAATKAQRTIGCHLKVDTGMTRMGARPEMVGAILDALAEEPALQLQGVMTHLANAVDTDYTAEQLAHFTEAAQLIRERVAGPLIWHSANSAAVLRAVQGDPSWYQPFALRAGDQCWVRPGIMLYGIAPFSEFVGVAPLQPVMQLKSQVVLIKHIPVGTKVSYSCTWEAKRPTRMAVLPIGYADGYAWGLSNAAEVLIRGRRVPVIGRVTMDMIMCDLTDHSDVVIGDEVVLLGRQGNEEIRAEAIAEACGTIPYETVARVSRRMPRIYI